MKLVLIALAVCAAAASAAPADVDVYSPEQLQQISRQLASAGANFKAEQLKKYGTADYTMVAFREATGSSELHEKEADFFFVVDGTATLVTGGKLVNAHTEKPGELRGTSIQGGERHQLAKGAIVHIPAGVPHQVLVTKGVPFTYFVVKVVNE